MIPFKIYEKIEIYLEWKQSEMRKSKEKPLKIT